jgi:hypothetical protein
MKNRRLRRRVTFFVSKIGVLKSSKRIFGVCAKNLRVSGLLKVFYSLVIWAWCPIVFWDDYEKIWRKTNCFDNNGGCRTFAGSYGGIQLE